MPPADTAPLYVDLDGTLIKTDLLHESLLGLVKRDPLAILRIPQWWWKGRACLKRNAAARSPLDVASLPYSASFLAYLQQQSAAGRKLVLATASDETYARQVAEHLGLFDGTLASDGTTNLSGSSKATAIAADARGVPFDYAGNSRRDGPVWDKARAAVLVNPTRGARKAVDGRTPVMASFTDRTGRLTRYLATLRPHQWVKNVLLLVPLLASHRWSDVPAVLDVALGIVAFSIAASSVYVLNDLLDLAADRQHPRKRHRPFAAGDVPVSHGVMLVPLLTLLALAVAAQVSLPFAGVLVAYLGMTLAYSLRLKHYVLVDVMVLAALFTLRVIAGSVAIAAQESFWMLAFCVFLFTSLALVKRCSELLAIGKLGVESAPGRDYRCSDSVPLLAMGVASGYLAVLVVAFYINSSAVLALYARPEALWLLCPILLYWVSRMWLKTFRGEMHDDPLVFAVKDRVSRIAGIAAAVVVLVAL